MHVGHIHLLREAKKIGDILMVCLSCDAQIKALKGESRPVNNLNDRLNLFKSIMHVDYVILYDEQNYATEQTLGDIIKTVNPEYWVKGSDYNKQDILNKHPYIKNVHLIENIDGKSTTLLIKEIQGSKI